MVRSFWIHENKYLRGERDSRSGARDSNAGWDLCTQLQLTRATNTFWVSHQAAHLASAGEELWAGDFGVALV